MSTILQPINIQDDPDIDLSSSHSPILHPKDSKSISSTASTKISIDKTNTASHPIRVVEGADEAMEKQSTCIVYVDEKRDLTEEKGDPEKIEDTTTTTSRQEDFPDGGLRAWLIVFGGMCNAFSTFGYVNSWGIFQAYYQETILKDLSPSSIAWIGSIQYALIFLPGLFVGRLFDLGYFHSIFLPCSALLILTTFLIAECTEYWHFLLCQGFAVGIACGGVFGPTNAVIAHWFKKRRGLALAYMAIGSSMGGTVVPIAARKMIPLVGFPWTMRIIGFILLFTLGIANITLKRRLPPVNVKGGLFNLAAFKDARYSIYCTSSFFTFLGIYTVLTYVNVSAMQLGSSISLSVYFVSIANAASLFGRWTAGLLADTIGPLNVMIPFTFFAGILTIAWPFTTNQASLIVVVLIYGFCSGTYVSLMSNPVMNLGEEGDVGRRIGMMFSLTAIGALIGPPISGAIEDATGGFKAVGGYAGSVVIAGVGCMVVTRYLVLKGWKGRM